jgi:hypothetical protein
MLPVLVAICVGGALLVARLMSRSISAGRVQNGAATAAQRKTSVLDDAIAKEKCELLRHRSDELQRNFLSLRVVEWRVAFQSYVGYGTIALAYNSLKPGGGAPCGLSRIMVVATAVLYFTSLYFSVRLQERLHFLREAQNRYLDALHRKLNVPKLEAGAADGPIHKRWYAFGAFQMIHLFAFFGILVYVAPKSECALPVTGLVVISLLAVAVSAVAIALKWYRTHSGGFKEVSSDDIWAA